MHKDTRDLVKRARKKGWYVRFGGSGHIKMTPPDGSPTVVIPATPSDHRAHLNLRALLRRRGLEP